MKKVLALIVALMMIVSMIPVMAITTSAANVPGDWTTWRSAGGYKEPDPGEEPSYCPAPGYEYTDEGFHMISADYTGHTPFGTIQSKEPVPVKDGVYMELRVDQYPYGGEKGTDDHWICFSLWDSAKIAPGNTTEYGQGWLALVRTPGEGGGGSAQSFVSKSAGNGTFGHQGDVSITPELDENGKEIYTFEVVWDGSNYNIAICGVAVQGAANIASHLNEVNPNGEFYVGVTFHSGAAAQPIEATMLKFGTSKDTAETPVGNDSAKPEENPSVPVDIIDSATIEANKPCLLLDAQETSCKISSMGTQGMTLTAQGDNAIRLDVHALPGFHTWGMKRTLSYEAADFPVIAVFYHDPNEIFESCTLRYAAGNVMAADDVHIFNYSIYDENYDNNVIVYDEDEYYKCVIIDLREYLGEEMFAEAWTGRINNLRFDYGSMYTMGDPETDFFFIQYAGIFRSVEEAAIYANEYAVAQGIVEEGAVTDPVPGDSTPVEPGDSTPVEPGESTPVESGSESTPAGSTPVESGSESTPAESDSTKDSAAESKTEKEEESTKEEKSGCGATVLGSVAVLLSAAAAAVVLKKKD